MTDMARGNTPHRRRLDADELERALNAHHGTELYSELQHFGQLLFDSAQQQVSAIESKGVSILGWSTAVIAVLSSGDLVTIQNSSWATKVLTLAGAAAALAAIWWSARCVDVREWQLPSQRDWLRTDLFDDVETLRGFHLLSLRESYDSHTRIQDEKAANLERAQWALMVSAAALGLIVIWKVGATVFV